MLKTTVSKLVRGTRVKTEQDATVQIHIRLVKVPLKRNRDAKPITATGNMNLNFEDILEKKITMHRQKTA